MQRVAVLVAGLFTLGGGAVAAQDQPAAGAVSPTQIQQMNPTRPGQAGSADTSQIGRADPAPLTTVGPTSRDRAVEGSSPTRANPTPLPQVTSEPARAVIDRQLALEDANAGPSASPADRARGRVTAVATPRGPDRCDPRGSRALAVECDRVIEARAGEFATPDFQPLSPEQRLLATQREQRPGSADVGAAARRLAGGMLDESNAALAVASITLNRPAGDPDEDETPTDTSAVDAIVAGITSLVTGAPPNP